jgi:WD40 repeat protein
MISELVNDLHDSLQVLPQRHRAWRMLEEIESFIRCDANFLFRHPTCLFQCMWNRGSSDLGLAEGVGGRPDASPLNSLLGTWRDARRRSIPHQPWVRLAASSLVGRSEGGSITLGPMLGAAHIAFARDGASLFCSSRHGTTCVWNVQTGLMKRRFSDPLRGEHRFQRTRSFSPDCNVLAIAAESDSRIHLWGVETEAELMAIETQPGNRLFALDFAAGGQAVVVGSQDNVRVISIATQQELFRAKTPCVLSDITASADSRWLAAGGSDGHVYLWEPGVSDIPRILEGHRDWVNSLSFSPDGRWLASGSNDATVRIWSTSDGIAARVLGEHRAAVDSVRFAPDGICVASGSRDWTLRLWDADSNIERASFATFGSIIDCLAFSLDGRYLASSDVAIHLWDARGSALERAGAGIGGPITCLDFSPDGKHIISGSEDHEVCVWDAQSGRPTRTLTGACEPIRDVCWIPDTQRVAGKSEDGTVHVWDAITGEMRAVLTCGGSAYIPAVPETPAAPHPVCGAPSLSRWSGIAVSPDGRRLASLWSAIHIMTAPEGQREGHVVCLWDPESGRQVAALGVPSHRQFSLRCSPDGAHLQVAGFTPQGTWTVYAFRFRDGAAVSVSTGVRLTRRRARSPETGRAYSVWADRDVRAEFAVMSEMDRVAVAWFPVFPRVTVAHPAALQWGVVSGLEVHVVCLEDA